MTEVRPFPARLVRQQHARRTVTAMSESQAESGLDLYGVAVDHGAYAEAPTGLYVYRQARDGSSCTGLVCDVAVHAVADGHVRGHEGVQQLRVDALVWHHARTTGPPALVSLLHRAGPGFTRAVAEAEASDPVLDFAGPDGFQQTVWRLDDSPSARDLVTELADAELYIADGHHRAAAAVREWGDAGEPAAAGLMCVVYPLEGLSLSAFHRRVPGPVDTGRLLALLREELEAHEVATPPTPATGSMGLYLAGSWYEVRIRAPRPPGPAGLDVSILQTCVLDRLGPDAAGRLRPVDTVPATAPTDQLVARCDVDGGALFTLAPPGAGTVLEMADAGQLMPPKTTFFEPKPAAGIFLRR